MHRKLILAMLALGLFVQAEGMSLAGPVVSDMFFLFGEVLPVVPEGGPESVTVSVPGSPPTLLVQLYEDRSLTVLSDQVFTNGEGSIVFQSDPNLSDFSGSSFSSVLKVAETGGVQDFTSFFGFPVAIQSDVDVPEPTTLTLFGIGTIGIVGYGWRKRKTA
jgi:hypothetical protein